MADLPAVIVERRRAAYDDLLERVLVGAAALGPGWPAPAIVGAAATWTAGKVSATSSPIGWTVQLALKMRDGGGSAWCPDPGSWATLANRLRSVHG